MSDKFEIFSPQHSTNSLTQIGFKSTHYALGELIDNSIQSAIEDKKNKSCDVQLIGIDKNSKLSNLIVIDDADCIVENEYVIDTLPLPEASFVIDSVIKVGELVEILNTSEFDVNWYWEFGNN